MSRIITFAGVWVRMGALLIGLTTCAASTSQPPPSPVPQEPPGDVLERVHERGLLVIASEADYPPHSEFRPDGTWGGFDIAVASEIARRLEVEPAFHVTTFAMILPGDWNNRYDMHVASMTVTRERAETLLFTDPYYYNPAVFVVHADSELTSIADLAGNVVGVAEHTTYAAYLENTLVLMDEEIQLPAPEVIVQLYDTSVEALSDLYQGDSVRLDAIIMALPTAQHAIDAGKPIRVLGKPVFYEQIAIAMDRDSEPSSERLYNEVNRIIAEMHEDGTLTALSVQFFGINIAQKSE